MDFVRTILAYWPVAELAPHDKVGNAQRETEAATETDVDIDIRADPTGGGAVWLAVPNTKGPFPCAPARSSASPSCRPRARGPLCGAAASCAAKTSLARQARSLGVRCFWLLVGHFPDKHERFLSGLDARTRAIVERGRVLPCCVSSAALLESLADHVCRVVSPRVFTRVPAAQDEEAAKEDRAATKIAAVAKGALARRRYRNSVNLGSTC